jgi:hypothetical protein
MVGSPAGAGFGLFLSKIRVLDGTFIAASARGPKVMQEEFNKRRDSYRTLRSDAHRLVSELYLVASQTLSSSFEVLAIPVDCGVWGHSCIGRWRPDLRRTIRGTPSQSMGYRNNDWDGGRVVAVACPPMAMAMFRYATSCMRSSS